MPGTPLFIGSSGLMDGDSQEIAVTFQQKFDSGASLEVIGAFSALDFARRLDADFSPLDLLGFDDTEDYEQTSLSVRFLTADAGRLRYVAGLYYQNTELALRGLTSLNTPTVAVVAGASCQMAGLSALDAQILFGLRPATIPPSPLISCNAPAVRQSSMPARISARHSTARIDQSGQRIGPAAHLRRRVDSPALLSQSRPRR